MMVISSKKRCDLYGFRWRRLLSNYSMTPAANTVVRNHPKLYAFMSSRTLSYVVVRSHIPYKRSSNRRIEKPMPEHVSLERMAKLRC